MGYGGTVVGTPPTSICTIPRRAMELVPKMADEIVDSGIDYMLDQVQSNTPKSQPVADPPPGYTYTPGGDGVHLRDEIHRTEIQEIGSVHSADVGSDKSYVIYVEEGTGLYGPKHAKYLIEPLGPWPLRFPGAGKWIHASHVWHPGSPGQHMFLIGGTMTEMSMDEFAQRGDLVLSEGMK